MSRHRGHMHLVGESRPFVPRSWHAAHIFLTVVTCGLCGPIYLALWQRKRLERRRYYRTGR